MQHASRGDRAIYWIEKFCLYPNGRYKGRHVHLTPQQRQTILRIYNTPDGFDEAVSGELGAYLALLHVVGPEAVGGEPMPQFATDIFSTWGAAGPELRAHLKLAGERIICSELGTRWPAAA